MKRAFTFSLVLFAILISSASTVLAQDAESVVHVSAPKPLAPLIRVVVKGFDAGYVLGPEFAGISGDWQGDLDITNIDVALQQLLQDTGYQPVVDGKIIHLKQVKASSQKTAPATADPDACNLKFDKGDLQPIAAALQTLSALCNYKVIYPTASDIPNLLVNLDGRQFTTTKGAVSGILDGTSYLPSLDMSQRTITIKRQVRQNNAVTSVRSEDSAVAQADPFRAVVEQIVSRYPNAYEADGTIGSFAQANAMNRELGAFNNVSRSRGDRGYEAGGYDEFFGNGYGADHSYVQRQIDQDTWGGLKLKKGSERLMESVEIWGCGKRITQADQANSIWDHVIPVPVNCTPLTFRYSDGKNDWEVEIPEMIVPFRMMNSKNITINENFFAAARKVTVFQKYTMTEQPDGSFKRTPR